MLSILLKGYNDGKKLVASIQVSGQQSLCFCWSTHGQHFKARRSGFLLDPARIRAETAPEFSTEMSETLLECLVYLV